MISEYTDPRTIAAHVHRSATTIRRYIKDGTLPATQIKNRWFVRVQDAERLFGGQRNEGTAQR